MNCILEVFDQYGLNADEVKQFVTFVTDRGSNFKYGIKDAGFERLTCYAHILHNLVSAMLQIEVVQEIITNAAKLTSHFKNQGLNAKLKTSLKLYTATRWNSVLIILLSSTQTYFFLNLVKLVCRLISSIFKKKRYLLNKSKFYFQMFVKKYNAIVY